MSWLVDLRSYLAHTELYETDWLTLNFMRWKTDFYLFPSERTVATEVPEFVY